MAVKKKQSSRTKTNKSRRNQVYRSFKKQPEHKKFLTFKVTEQTLYWAVLGLVVLGFGAWLLKLQFDINVILNSIL